MINKSISIYMLSVREKVKIKEFKKAEGKWWEKLYHAKIKRKESIVKSDKTEFQMKCIKSTKKVTFKL